MIRKRKPNSTNGHDNFRPLAIDIQPALREADHHWADVAAKIACGRRQALLKKTLCKFAGAASKFENAPGVLEARMGHQVIERRVFVETLTVLFLAESVVVSLRVRRT